MKYFSNCTTLDEVKSTYRALAKEHHPDKGGDLETMQHINREYSFAIAKITSGQGLSAEETEATILSAEKYREALEKIIHVHDIVIELVGTWIWVTGNTYPHRSKEKGGTGILPEAGFLFARKKVAWYFRSEEFKVRNFKKMSLDQIRNRYGSQSIKSKADEKSLS